MLLMPDFVLALTTLPEKFDAPVLAQELVGAGLAACVTIVPAVRSVYRWQGAMHTDAEQQLIIKTTSDLVDPLWDVLKDRHPYEVPEFVVVPIVDGSRDYLQWIERHVGPTMES
jgi:periplasmic divalent cation tolerance protein